MAMMNNCLMKGEGVTYFVFIFMPHSFIVEVEMAIRGDVETAGSSFEVS